MVNKLPVKPLVETETRHVMALSKAALDRDDLLTWCKIAAADEDCMKLHGIFHGGPTVYHRLVDALTRLGYKPGNVRS